MHSLRSRLAAIFALGVFVITVTATMAIIVERWQESTAGAGDRVALAAFELSETPDRVDVRIELREVKDTGFLLLDETAQIVARAGAVTPQQEQIAQEELWPEILDQDASVSVVTGDSHLSAAGCLSPEVCDTAVVVATELPFSRYLGQRWIWAITPALAASMAAVAATRWVVGRSLRPVDKMRAELETITAGDLDQRVSAPQTGDELEALGLAMNDTVGRLSAAVASNRRFVADAAHELRSPITGVRAAVELEAAKAPGGILDDGVRELDRAARLIDDLLMLARSGDGDQQRSTHVDVDLDDLALEQLNLVGQRFPDVRISHSISPTRVRGDADALRRVIANLVENACLHGDGRVAVGLTCRDGRAELTIEDNGAGIPPSDRELVFERFARLDESRARSTGGSGLGLAIVAEIANAHHATVEISDSELGGAQVRVRFG